MAVESERAKNEASKRPEGRLSHLACRISCYEGLTLAALTSTVSSFAADALVTAISGRNRVLSLAELGPMRPSGLGAEI
jgi:hypothetical protein